MYGFDPLTRYINNLLGKVMAVVLTFAIGCFVIATFIPSVSSFFSLLGGIAILILCFSGAIFFRQRGRFWN